MKTHQSGESATIWTVEEAGVVDLVQRLDLLCEPYRQNAIAWLEACAHERFVDVGPDLTEFLGRLAPVVRDRFLLHTGAILDDALRYFGAKNGKGHDSAPTGSG